VTFSEDSVYTIYNAARFTITRVLGDVVGDSWAVAGESGTNQIVHVRGEGDNLTSYPVKVV